MAIYIVGTIPSPGDDSAYQALVNAPGVVSTHKLDTQAELNTYYHSNRLPVLDSSIKPPGFNAMMRLDRLSSDGQGATNVRIPLGTYTEGDVFWLSYLMWVSPEYLYQVSAASSQTWGQRKFDTVASFDFSNEPWELVSQLTNAERTWRHYHQDGQSTAVHDETTFTSFYQGGDIKRQPAVDNSINPIVSYPLTGVNPDTGAAWNAGEQERRRFGGTFGPRSLSLADYRVGIGDPLAGSFSPHSQLVRYTRCLEIGTFNTNSSRLRVWAALFGQPYFQLIDLSNIRLGAPGPYGANWLNLFESTKIANSGRRVQSRTNELSMIKIRSFGLGTPLGPSTLSWNAGTQLLSFAANGQTVARACGFSAQKRTANLISNDGSANPAQNSDSYMGVELEGTLPGVNTTETVTVEAGLDTASVRYGGWIESRQEIKSEGGHRALSTTQFETLTANLAPGQRVQLTGMAGFTNSNWEGSAAGAYIFQYGPRGHYDPSRREVWYLNSDHTGGGSLQKEVVFRLTTHDWVFATGPDGASGPAHTYYHPCIDRRNGTRYMKPMAFDAGDPHITRRRIYGQGWTTVATTPEGSHLGAMEYHYGFNGLVYGMSEGIYTSNAAVSSWTERLNLNRGGWFHPFAVSLHKRNEVYLGGGAAANDSNLRWWRINANQTVTEMPALPKSMGVSGLGAALEHPDGRRIICMGGAPGDKSVIVFDPVTGQWSSNLGNHSFGENGGNDYVFYVSLPEIHADTGGRMLVVQSLGGGSPTCWGYRPPE